jgi:hypothetical protein
MPKMTKKLPHAEIIKHITDHGFDSVQVRDKHIDVWNCGDVHVNPVTCPSLVWRKTPETVDVFIRDLPMAEKKAPECNTRYFMLLSHSECVWNGTQLDRLALKMRRVYLDMDQRDIANRILSNALEGLDRE